jgi:circadian clock protein KaiC
MDTWLLLRNMEHDGRRCGAFYVLKSRGMPHSRDMREFTLTNQGVRVGEIYTKNFHSDVNHL